MASVNTTAFAEALQRRQGTANRRVCGLRECRAWSAHRVRRALAVAAVVAAVVGMPLHAQDVPQVVSPLRVDTDHNGVNLLDGKAQMALPVLAVPAAPRLRFERVQNAAPYISGKIYGGGDMGTTTSGYSVHTGGGRSEAFRCVDFDPCNSVTGTGSTLVGTGPFVFQEAGSGAIYNFNLKHVKTSGASPLTVLYYASSVIYPNGETITYTYQTATLPGDPFGRTFYRPTRIESNLGFFITLSYQGDTFPSNDWNTVREAAIYNSADPSTALGRLTYGTDGTITDLGGRVFRCTGCTNALGANLEVAAGTLQLPGEASASLQAVAVSGTTLLVGSVMRDGVQWNYTYTNPRYDAASDSYWYDRITVTGPNGYYTAYDMRVFDGRNVITQITDALGRVTSVDFDNNYRVTRIVYPEGNEVSVTYDSYGNLTSRVKRPKPGSGLATFTETVHYDTAGCSGVLCYRPSWYRDALGRQTDFRFNAAGQLIEQTDPPDASGVRRKTYITYDTTSGISRRSVVRICGDTTTCGTSVEIRTEYEYWGKTLLPSVERRIDAARGEVLETRYTYDAAGRLLVEDGPLPGTEDAKYYRYDVHGRRTWEIGSVGASGLRTARRFTYRDADDQVVSVEEGTVADPTSPTLTVYRRTDYGYDSRRNPVREALSASGTTYRVVQRAFDDAGRLECEALRMNPSAFAALPTSACTLGPEGSFGPDRITRHVYDAAGQLLQVQRAYGTALQQSYATYTYSANGQRTSVTDAKGNRSEFRYDGHDRLSRWVFPSPSTPGAVNEADYEAYDYDAVGNRISLRRRDGTTLTFQYDALNRVTVKTVPASASGVTGYSVYYGYDVQGLPLYARFGSPSGSGITYSYDAFGRLRTRSVFGRTLAYEYDAAGRRRRITHPDGFYAEYQYSPAGELTRVTDSTGATLATYTYDGLGRRTGFGRGNGAGTGYGYDGRGRLAALTQDLAGGDFDSTLTFAYAPSDQITSRNQNNDAAYTWRPAASGSLAMAHNGLNQLTQIGTTAVTHDALGNVTSGESALTYRYDAENHLRSATGGGTSVTLEYDPAGRLSSLAAGGATTSFLYDGDALVVEYDGSGAVRRRYVHAAGVDEPIVWYEGAGFTDRRYFHADERGSIVALSNASGAGLESFRYSPDGEAANAAASRFGFTGQAYLPELGLYDYKARMYSPRLRRFLQTDPVGYEDDLNLYAYVKNDPLNSIDPTGTETGAAFASVECATAGTCAAAPPPGAVEELIVDFIPIVGDIKGVIEAAQNPSAISITATVVGLAPGIGDVASKVLKTGGNILENAAKGARAEEEVAARYGENVAGRRVTLESSTGERSVADFVTKDKSVVEVKSGNAKLSSGQKAVRADIEAGRPVTPRGRNAEAAGLPPGQPIKIRCYKVERCP